MAGFRLPSNRITQGTRQVIPSNYGRANAFDSVQAQVDNYVAAANARLIEAIAVDGVEINFWHKGTEGRYCTCQDPKRVEEPHTQSSDQPIDSRSLNIFADDLSNDTNDSPGFTVRGAYDLRENLDYNPRRVFGDIEIGRVAEDEDVGRPKSYNEDTNNDDDLERDVDDDAFLKMGSDAGLLFGGDSKPCGICFGTGYVGGYSLFAGKREIFDQSSTYMVTAERMFYRERSTKPYSFVGPSDPSAYVQWTYELPTYFVKACSLVVRNNTKRAQNLSILYQIVGSSDAFAPLTIDWINSRNGTPTTIYLRVVPSTLSMESKTIFTHVEMTIQTAPWPKIQMAALTEQTNYQVYDTLLTTSFIMPPTLAHVGKEDVVYESKYERLWKISDSTDQMTARRQIMGWTANARVVQDYEQLALLKLTMKINYELTYSGLELKQGLGLANAGQFE